jgi:hypothetical protein
MVQAQSEMFKDVPSTHWAYEDVRVLKADGLLTGYPGEVFLGNRPMTRYEFATATRAMFENLLKKIGDITSIQSRIAALETTSSGTSVTAEVSALKEQLAGMAYLKDDAARLNKLAVEFEKELASLGVSVQELTVRTTELEKLVAELMKRPVPIDIHGDLFFGVRAGYGEGTKYGVDLNSNLFGINQNSEYQTSNPVKDLHMVHELGLNVNGNFGNGVTGYAEFVIGNFMDWIDVATTPQGGYFTGYDYRHADDTQLAVWAANVTFPMKFMGETTVKLGRLGYQVTPYTFSRVDPDFYFDVARYDDGNIYFDGGKLDFKFSNVKLDIFGGKNQSIENSDDVFFQTITAGRLEGSTFYRRPHGLREGVLTVDTTLGANLNVGLGSTANLGLTYILLDGEELSNYSLATRGPGDFNRVAVYGANAAVELTKGLNVKAEFAASQVMFNNHNVLSHDNTAWDVNATYDVANSFQLKAGYKEVMPFFNAPGSWGRIGFWYNPTDIKGFTVGAKYALSDAFTIGASGEFYQGTGKVAEADDVYGLDGFLTSDKVNRFVVNATYKVSPVWTLTADWEGVNWDIQDRVYYYGDGESDYDYSDGGKPTENYFTFGVDYMLGKNANLKFKYQVMNYDAKGTDFFVVDNANGNGDKLAGGLFILQGTVKF